LAIAVSINEIIGAMEFILNNGWELLRMFFHAGGISVEGSNIRILNPQFYLERIPIVLHPFEVLGAAFLAVLLSVSASVLPARSAGKLKPLEVLVKH
jgi:lipoprotein-releasing system permease protein